MYAPLSGDTALVHEAEDDSGVEVIGKQKDTPNFSPFTGDRNDTNKSHRHTSVAT